MKAQKPTIIQKQKPFKIFFTLPKPGFGRRLKVVFFRKCDSFFKSPNLQKENIPKNYPELEIQNSCPKHTTDMGGNFKFQVQDSF